MCKKKKKGKMMGKKEKKCRESRSGIFYGEVFNLPLW